MNPVQIAVNEANLNSIASFTQGVVTTITSIPAGLRVVVDWTIQTTPRRYIWAAGTPHTLQVATPVQTTTVGASRHEFTRWSNGGENGQTYIATAGAVTMTAEFSSKHRVSVVSSPSVGGGITIEPPLPADGFAAAGTELTFTATPRGGNQFTGWSDDLSGQAAVQRMTVGRDLYVSARFAVPNQLTISGLVNGASQIGSPLAPGEIVTLYGLEIGPVEPAGLALTSEGRVATVLNNTRVLFNGVAAPLIYVSSGQINCIVPYSLSVAMFVQGEVGTRVTNRIAVFVQPASPAFFTYNSSGGGGGRF